MATQNVFNVISDTELNHFSAYLRRVLPTPEAQAALKEAQGFAEDVGDHGSAKMIEGYRVDVVGKVDFDTLDQWDAMEVAAWLFQHGGGTIEIA